MHRSTIRPAAIAAMLVLGTSAAAFAATGESEGGREIATVLGAKTSVVQAIAAAEQKTAGRAMRIGIEETKGRELYEVKTLSKDKVAIALVDPATGQVVQVEDEGLIARAFDRDDRAEFAKLAASPTTLAAAVATAEGKTGGKAIEASFDNENGSMVFEVEVAKGAAVQKVMIDGVSGKVLRVANAEHRGHDED